MTVSDFDLQVIPSVLTVDQNGQASLGLNVTISQGFSAPLKLTVIGLPEGAMILLAPSNVTLLLTAPSSTAFNLQFATLKQGSYTVTINLVATLQSGDSISHSRTIQLTVR